MQNKKEKRRNLYNQLRMSNTLNVGILNKRSGKLRRKYYQKNKFHRIEGYQVPD